MKAGKQTLLNRLALRRLKEIYSCTTISSCEIRMEGCRNFILGFAHRHKRIWYRSHPKLLATFNQTVLACTHCHNIIEYDRELSDEIFMRLRGEELNVEKD